MMSPGLNSNAEPEADPSVSLGLEPTVDSGIASTVDLNPDAWRVEVAARLERYRTRRKPRTPRYPSLLLPFDAPESWSRSTAATVTGADGSGAELEWPVASGQWPENEPSDSPRADHRPPDTSPEPAELSAKVIEFPRSAALPTFHPSDLADPVFDHDLPRIVEAPEILPPPPALGGMLIEAARREQVDPRTDLATAAPSASIARRGLAAAIDGAIVGVAVVVFAAIFLRLNSSLISGLVPSFGPMSNFSSSSMLHAGLGVVQSPVRATLLVLAAALGALVLLLGFAYEFLLVVYTGSTPGLRAARLRLAHFDGSPLDRRQRRWRVLASFLSALSAGLGYLWCVLDQNGLCWHDRITHTYIQSS
jgi:uncharacterized RDD family membrane protein YckC